MEKYYKASDVGAIIEQLLKTPYYQHEGESWYSGVSAVWDGLISLDTIELDEPKEGRWLFSDYGGIHYYQCSCCDYDLEIPHTYTKDDIKKYKKYCVHCGAKMGD